MHLNRTILQGMRKKLKLHTAECPVDTRRDVPVERLYRVLGFMHVSPKLEICCK
jgi:hypothetical protein